MSERRKDKRVTAQLKVWCEGDSFTLLAETLNLGLKGLFVRTSTPPPTDERFTVTIEELGAVAEVELRWTRGPTQPGRAGLGLAIIGFKRGGQAYERYIERNSSKSGEHKLTWTGPPGADSPDQPDDPNS